MSREDKLRLRMRTVVKTSRDPLDQITATCLSQGYSGILALGRRFRRLDKSRCWMLSRTEVTSVLSDLGLKLSKDALKDLLDQFDPENTGSLDYDEFLDAIRPPMSDPRKEVVAMAFNMLDETEDGFVNLDDLRKRYSASSHPKVLSGEQSPEEVTQRLVARFENSVGGDGKMTKAEFFDYYTAVSQGIEDDDYFVEMMRKAWSLPL